MRVAHLLMHSMQSARLRLQKTALVLALCLLSQHVLGFAVTRASLLQKRQSQLGALPFARPRVNLQKKYPPLPHLPQATGHRSPVNRARNLQAIHEVRELAKRAELVIALNMTSLNAYEDTTLRQSLPANATLRAVRKRLFKLAVYGTNFEDLEDHLTGQNMYIFCKDSDAVPTLRAVHKFINTNPRVKRHGPIKAYSTPTQLFTKANTTFMQKLRTKEECVIRLKQIVIGQQLRLIRALKVLAEKTANATLTTDGLVAADTNAPEMNVTLSGVNVTVPGGVNMAEVEGWLNKTMTEVTRFAENIENGTVAQPVNATANSPAANRTTNASSTPIPSRPNASVESAVASHAQPNATSVQTPVKPPALNGTVSTSIPDATRAQSDQQQLLPPEEEPKPPPDKAIIPPAIATPPETSVPDTVTQATTPNTSTLTSES